MLTLLGAAVVAYARDQVRGTIWALAPITRTLPWNKGDIDPTFRPPLFSECTLVDVFLLDAAGTRARDQIGDVLFLFKPCGCLGSLVLSVVITAVLLMFLGFVGSLAVFRLILLGSTGCRGLVRVTLSHPGHRSC